MKDFIMAHPYLSFALAIMILIVINEAIEGILECFKNRKGDEDE